MGRIGGSGAGGGGQGGKGHGAVAGEAEGGGARERGGKENEEPSDAAHQRRRGEDLEERERDYEGFRRRRFSTELVECVEIITIGMTATHDTR